MNPGRRVAANSGWSCRADPSPRARIAGEADSWDFGVRRVYLDATQAPGRPLRMRLAAA